jgi:hypothetical protein
MENRIAGVNTEDCRVCDSKRERTEMPGDRGQGKERGETLTSDKDGGPKRNLKRTRAQNKRGDSCVVTRAKRSVSPICRHN